MSLRLRALAGMRGKAVDGLSAPVVGAVRLGVAEDCIASFLPLLMGDMPDDVSRVQLDILCRGAAARTA